MASNSPRKTLFLQIVALFLTISSVAGFFRVGILYYVMLAIMALSFFFQPSLSIKTGIPIILVFLIACATSLIVNDVPAYFNATNRLLVYILVLIVVSPLFTNKYIGDIRNKVFIYSLVVLSLLSIGSFFAYFLGINLFIRDGRELEIGAGSFSGLMNHSMVLGPFSAISAIFLLSLYLTTFKRFNRLLFLTGTLCCLGACFFAASRIALAGGFFGCIMVIMRFYKGHMSKAIVILLCILALAAITFPIWGGVTDFVQAKQMGNEEKGSALYSREKKIAARTLEFQSSPLFGIGFCTVDPRYDIVQYENGQIEPGSSWLAIPSMTGLFGLISFISICVVVFKQASKIRSIRSGCMLIGILSFYMIHLLAEGYIMAPRSYLNMFFWLLVGSINSEYQKSFYSPNIK